ncbi:hypothetical protein Q5752_006753 [Cryptotrichosporon argae]
MTPPGKWYCRLRRQGSDLLYFGVDDLAMDPSFAGNKHWPRDELVKGGVTLGRQHAPDSYSRIISSPIISRTHVQLVLGPNGLVYALDCKSMHGTSVRRTVLAEPERAQAYVPCVLAEGAELILGKTIFSSGTNHYPPTFIMEYNNIEYSPSDIERQPTSLYTSQADIDAIKARQSEVERQVWMPEARARSSWFRAPINIESDSEVDSDDGIVPVPAMQAVAATAAAASPSVLSDDDDVELLPRGPLAHPNDPIELDVSDGCRSPSPLDNMIADIINDAENINRPMLPAIRRVIFDRAMKVRAEETESTPPLPSLGSKMAWSPTWRSPTARERADSDTSPAKTSRLEHPMDISGQDMTNDGVSAPMQPFLPVPPATFSPAEVALLSGLAYSPPLPPSPAVASSPRVISMSRRLFSNAPAKGLDVQSIIESDADDMADEHSVAEPHDGDSCERNTAAEDDRKSIVAVDIIPIAATSVPSPGLPSSMSLNIDTVAIDDTPLGPIVFTANAETEVFASGMSDDDHVSVHDASDEEPESECREQSDYEEGEESHDLGVEHDRTGVLDVSDDAMDEDGGSYDGESDEDFNESDEDGFSDDGGASDVSDNGDNEDNMSATSYYSRQSSQASLASDDEESVHSDGGSSSESDYSVASSRSSSPSLGEEEAHMSEASYCAPDEAVTEAEHMNPHSPRPTARPTLGVNVGSSRIVERLIREGSTGAISPVERPQVPGTWFSYDLEDEHEKEEDTGVKDGEEIEEKRMGDEVEEPAPSIVQSAEAEVLAPVEGKEPAHDMEGSAWTVPELVRTRTTSPVSSGPPTTPPSLRKRDLDAFVRSQADDVDVAISTEDTPIALGQAHVAPEDRPIKKLRSLAGTVGLIAFGAALGSVGTIAGLMQLAD